MVIGCARAVRAAGSHARLIGVGGSKLAVASIKAGAVDGTVCFKPEALGALAFEALHTPQAGPRFRTYPIPAVTREIGRAHVRTPVTNAHLVCRLLLENKKHK